MRTQVRYHGRVQGVGFRMTARAIASRYPVTGWVRNEGDGTVILEAQGTDQAVEAFLAELANHMERCIASTDRAAAIEQSAETGFTIRK